MEESDKQWVNENLDPEEKEKAGDYGDGAYTISFINGSPGLVIRANHSKEMENRIRAVLPIFKRFKEAIKHASEVTQSAPNPAPEAEAVCTVHGVKMSSAISKKTNNPYFYHDSQDGVRCFGEGYKPRSQ